MSVAIRRMGGNGNDADTDPLCHGVELPSELPVVVANQELGSLTPRRRVPELLRDPRTGGRTAHTDMDDPPRADLEDHEREDPPEKHIVCLQEVAGPDVPAMIAEKGAPGLPAGSGTPCRARVLLDRALGVPDAEFEQLATNALRTPESGVASHLANKPDGFTCYAGFATLRSGLVLPEELEAVAMPAQ